MSTENKTQLDGVIIPSATVNAAREAVGIFDDETSLQAAIDELTVSGFARCQLSVLKKGSMNPVNESTVLAADDPQVERTDYFCPEVQGEVTGSLIAGFAMVPMFSTEIAVAASGATVLAGIGATVVSGGIGALIGGAIAIMIARKHHAKLADQVDHGGLLLWVHTKSPEYEQRAIDILSRHAGHHVHSHDRPS